MACAADLVLIEESPSVLKSLFDHLQKMASKVGLQKNAAKMEYMVVGRRETVNTYTSLDFGCKKLRFQQSQVA